MAVRTSAHRLARRAQSEPKCPWGRPPTRPRTRPQRGRIALTPRPGTHSVAGEAYRPRRRRKRRVNAGEERRPPPSGAGAASAAAATAAAAAAAAATAACSSALRPTTSLRRPRRAHHGAAGPTSARVTGLLQGPGIEEVVAVDATGSGAPLVTVESACGLCSSTSPRLAERHHFLLISRPEH